MEKHTPGPWVWEKNGNRLYGPGDSTALEGCTAHDLYFGETDVAAGNRALITAAPEMLLALVEVATAFVLYKEDRGPIGKRVLAAIAKAKGNS